MMQRAIPYHFFRGGTSRGPVFNRADLPEDRERLSDVLIGAVGAGHPLNIDGIGGGAAVTTKVVMLSPSEVPGIDVDYFFAQVAVEERAVDYAPTCGNMLVAVAPAAIEMGLVPAQDGETPVSIRAVNTGATVRAVVQTPGGAVTYAGDQVVDGVPGTAAPVTLAFSNVVGGSTGQMLPTGSARDRIEGVEVTCLDVAMPMVIAQAEDFGLTGHETRAALDENSAFFARMEAVRRAAGAAMGMGDVSKSVVPKFGLVAQARAGGDLAVRYFMPWKTHPTVAVTGAQCLAACALMPGSVADGLCDKTGGIVTLEHPMGQLDVLMEVTRDPFAVRSTGLTRSARLIARGEVMIPEGVWP
ncbi:MAG: PrpF domain-containing protein [Pseudomonadota bacterium]